MANSMLTALLKGYERYYNTVTGMGHVQQKYVNNLIVASWIYDVLMGKYGQVDEDQYKILDNLYTCIEGSCLVPYQAYCKDITVNKEMVSNYIRMTEDSVMRWTEDDELRMA